MNDDFLKISYEDLLRNPDLIDQVQRDARRYRAREVRRVLQDSWASLTSDSKPEKHGLRTASCG